MDLTELFRDEAVLDHLFDGFHKREWGHPDMVRWGFERSTKLHCGSVGDACTQHLDGVSVVLPHICW
jgi:hypothetical protein